MFGCRKTNFDATKVTYNKYLCAISGMSREMMKMDGRDSVECQNWENKDVNVVFEIVSWIIGQNVYSVCLLQNSKRENVKWGRKKLKKVANGGFRERTSSFSLKYRAIRPSAVFETRRKAALREAGYAWTPDLRIFDKLREVGVSPYLGFTLYLSVLQCFGWLEALNDRLIGPKTWDRIIENY